MEPFIKTIRVKKDGAIKGAAADLQTVWKAEYEIEDYQKNVKRLDGSKFSNFTQIIEVIILNLPDKRAALFFILGRNFVHRWLHCKHKALRQSDQRHAVLFHYSDLFHSKL